MHKPATNVVSYESRVTEEHTNLVSQLTRSLRFQIISALVGMLVVFTAAKTYTFFALEDQRNNLVILNLAAKLQLAEQQLATQAMNYKENAPPDVQTYSRDVQLYYRDLIGHVDAFDMLCNAFMDREFDPQVTGLSDAFHTSLDQDTRDAVNRLEDIWNPYRKDLMAVLGPDPQRPQLQAAAEYVTNNHLQLEQAAKSLQQEIQHLVRSHLDRINLINRLALLTAFIVAVVIIFWFYRKVVNPLERAEMGFRKVAQGDFGHQVQIRSNNEIAGMTDSFNRLSRRLNAIFRLIGHVQQGSDLHATLKFVGEDFSHFLPLDWLGVLFLSGDGTTLNLEKSFLNGKPDIAGPSSYQLENTLLQKALQSGEPLHVSDMELTAKQNKNYVFLQALVAKGMRDAIFLPFADRSPIPGVLVFASNEANVYTAEHLELLTNIAHLVTHSFGQTVKLAEHAHLAAVGEFASGVAHEIRSPLATISIALDYITKMDLPDAARKRTELASQEADRMARLLNDILLYAKSLSLNMQRVDLSETLEQLLETNRDLASAREQSFVYSRKTEQTTVYGDPDRLVQIFLNLAKNACEAAPDDSKIQWILDRSTTRDALLVSVHNEGDSIPPEILPRVFEPFFTTKPHGTGLGLSVVKRMVNAHGGEIEVNSDEQGTRTTVTLPLAANL